MLTCCPTLGHSLNYEVLKRISQVGLYVGPLVSLLSSLISLQFKTSHEPTLGHRKNLTPFGKLYIGLLIGTFVITVASAICQNYADSKLKEEAEQRGTKAVTDALEGQHKRYIADLTDKFEGANGVLPKLGQQTKALKTAESLIVTKSTETISQLTGSESYAVLHYVPAQGFLVFTHNRKYPLYGVSARITDLDQQQNLIGVTVEIGDMIRGHANSEPIPRGIPVSGDHFYSNIFFTARNGDWVELLRVVRVNDGWAVAIRVFGQFTSLKREKVMCETIDPKFPQDAKTLGADFTRIKGIKAPRCL